MSQVYALMRYYVIMGRIFQFFSLYTYADNMGNHRTFIIDTDMLLN